MCHYSWSVLYRPLHWFCKLSISKRRKINKEHIQRVFINTITPPFGLLLRKIWRLVALTVKIAQFDNSIFNSPTYFMYMARKAIPHLQAD